MLEKRNVGVKKKREGKRLEGEGEGDRATVLPDRVVLVPKVA